MSDAGRRIFCFGLGYSAEVLTRRLQAHGWSVAGTSRDPDRRRALEDLGFEMVPFDRETPVSAGVLAQTTHVLTSVATDTEGDPVLGVHARDLADLPTLTWAGYLSSTTVYGDHGGATVNEDSQLRPTQERSVRRAAAERAWLASGLPAHVFRLGGIYGPGRNVIQGLRTGRTRHVVRAGQVFSRIHVEDIATTIEASIAQPEPLLIYNVTDDEPCGVSAVLEFTAALLGVPCPPPVSFEEADLTPAARKFYLDSRRVSNRRIREGLGVELRYPTYREGITALALDA